MFVVPIDIIFEVFPSDYDKSVFGDGQKRVDIILGCPRLVKLTQIRVKKKNFTVNILPRFIFFIAK